MLIIRKPTAKMNQAYPCIVSKLPPPCRIDAKASSNVDHFDVSFDQA
jgi:hypothetical protein